MCFSEILLVSLLEFIFTLESEDFLNLSNLGFNVDEGFVFVDSSGGILHGLDASSHVVVGPDDHIDTPLSEGIGGNGVVVGGNNNDGGSVLPFLHESFDFRGFFKLGVHEDGISTSQSVGISSLEGFFQTPTSDESFNSSDNLEVSILLGILASLDLSNEFIDGSQFLSTTI